jgi:heterodisulfide reductase subunit C
MAINTSKHCDLCGVVLVSNRANGWEGSVRLIREGNFYSDFDGKEMKLCYECGMSVSSCIRSLKKDFTLKTVVEYKENK